MSTGLGASDILDCKEEDSPMHDRVPLSRDSLSTKAYQRLRRDLMEGRFQPGQKLKLRDLARELGTSPTPVREALARLVSDMALTQMDHHSVSVPPMTSQRFVEIRDLRLELEGRAAAAAADKASEAAIAELTKIHASQMTLQEAGRWTEALVEDQRFHLALCACAEMPVLLRMVESLWMQIGPMQHALGHHRVAKEPGRHPHQIILDGLRKRDSKLTRHGLQQDLLVHSEPVVRFLESQEGRERPPAKPAKPRRQAIAPLIRVAERVKIGAPTLADPRRTRVRPV
jgi:DNA-binding GntR family transcriptional regulator